MRVEAFRPTVFCDLDQLTGKKERCGVILGNIESDHHYVVKRLAEVRNVHPEPYENFRMERTAVARVVKRSLYGVLGYWHTHPLAGQMEPSNADYAMLKRKPRCIGLIWCPVERMALWYDEELVFKREKI